MTSHQAVKSFKKSSVPGVTITQFVDDIPNGCSTPDFERKPVTLTLQEGKNAIFRAVVKGVPTPDVKWTRMQGGMDDPAKYETFFNNVTNEFILQINKLTTDDSDLYRCFAVNEYGEAACSAGLRIIQELKKKLQEFRKLLRKRAPAPKPKPLDKEAVWQLLLHADRRDYEKICMKYGIVDFRGMLRKLQEMRKDTESEQGELLHSIRNFEHIKVNKDGKATFSLVMDLKNHNSKVYLLKDGERLRYGTGDEYRKHCLRRIGKRYSFIVNDVQPEDAGVYQVRVEDVPVFSTELDAESIPVRFQQPLSDVRCSEEEDAVFDCILRTPCYDAVWLHKTHLLEASEKHQISVTPDGLTHQLIIKNVVPSDNGMYTLDTGLCSSNAWLIVECGGVIGSAIRGAGSPYGKDSGSAGARAGVGGVGRLGAPPCYVNKQLLDVRVLKGEPAELSCTVSKHEVTGTWFKDGLKLTNMDGVLFEKEGLVHKLIINKVEDIHAGKYRFEGGDIKTEASIFVEDPPQVDKVLLKNLTSVPTVAKAGQKVKIKIPFEGRLPIRATWLKDRMELVDDTRIRVDKTETFTMLSISSSERKDCGDYQVRLKNDSGVLEINLKLVVIDKPQPPAGPIKIVESSANNITIQWKPPKDDGGKPVQRYIVERQQVGKNDWVTLGETPRSCTTFTTNKVEQDMSYYFRVRAVNAEGTSDALESDEVKAVGKASPGAPDPPEIVSASRDTITICWKAPRKTGSSRIVGYIVQKRKKGTMTWLPVNNVPIADKKLKMTNLKKGLQYEFRVAAVNAAGIGDASEPSQPVFARDSTSQVQDLKVSSSDSTSVTLTWRRPEAKDGSDVKGYEVEMRSSNSLNWTKCNNLPIEMTTYTVKGLQAKEIYFLRVRALNDSGPGEAAELEACIEAAPAVVSPRLLIDDTVKSFLVIKAGNTIRVNIPFEASPDPVVTWLKDGLPLSNRAKINTKDGTTQLLIAAAEFADSGTYTVELQNGLGKRETFSFQVQITDIPQSPGPIQLEENVPNTVTVTWEPSPSEKWESNLYYTVLKRESQKGLWHMVGDLIYTNKFTFTKLIPGRDYYFRVVAKNSLGASDPSETVQPWSIRKPKVKPQKYRGVNQNQPPRFLVPLKPHVVTTGSECHMSCAIGGHPPPKITWYKDSRDLSNDPTYFCTNDFGVCSLVVLGVTKHDEGEYMVEATNESGRAFSKAFLTIKGISL
ncbi:PREDICTED: immunoglobulin-like and fibronectin type III domain-containing protein 1 [Haliaeetus leucocephalus]|uniref:immunoglobulin-like and fibronectin type III domain-containing protein 1 n=1 Tax=Haliaeetus leucocephalus TaxID=52644 RepID=UPI00053CC6BA|nr:PREDICTED: immunoglobulin-like and fibronectin type III domain-containing protein 1 [Haliaeetus leucocephalus]